MRLNNRVGKIKNLNHSESGKVGKGAFAVKERYVYAKVCSVLLLLRLASLIFPFVSRDTG